MVSEQEYEKSHTRAADLAARYGGEEFVCILPETELCAAVAIAEKIRQGIIARAIPPQWVKRCRLRDRQHGRSNSARHSGQISLSHFIAG